MTTITPAPAATNVHVRTVPLEYSEGELYGRLVPLNRSTRVVDVLANGKLDVYEEGFREGVFDRQMADTAMIRRIAFWHTHDHQDGAGYFGPATNLEQRDDGIYGSFRILTSKRADLRDLMDEGVVNLSIEFKERSGGTAVDDDGVRWRTSAHLHGVALDPRGAYPGAEVLAFRSVDDLVEEYQAEQEQAREREAAEAAEAAERERQEAEQRAAEEKRQERAKVLAELEDWVRQQRAQA